MGRKAQSRTTFWLGLWVACACTFVAAGCEGETYVPGIGRMSTSQYEAHRAEQDRRAAEAWAARVASFNRRLDAADSLGAFARLAESAPTKRDFLGRIEDNSCLTRLVEKRRQWYCATSPNLPRSVVEAITHGKVVVGMTTEHVRASWGEPDKINRSGNLYGVREQWVYRRPYEHVYVGYSVHYSTRHESHYLYFEDGILTAWQE